MNNWNIATEASSTALNSQGSSMKEQSKYADSLEARINRLDTAWNKFTLSVGNAVLTDSLIAGLSSLTDLANGASVVVDKIGVLSIAFGTIGAASVLLSTRFRTFTTSLILGTEGMTGAQLATVGLSAGMSRLSIATVGAKTALRGLLASTVVGAVFVGIGFAIEKLISVYSKAKQKQEEFEEYQQKGVNALTTNKDQVDKLITSYEELSKQKESGKWDTENEKEYLQIQQKLGEVYPQLIASVDANGQYHLKSKNEIDKEIKSTQELIKLKQDEIKFNAQKNFDDNIDKLDGFFGLDSKISRKKDQIGELKDVGADPAVINKAKQELYLLKSEWSTTAQKISDEILKVSDAYNKLEINPNISRSVDNFISSLDFTKMDSSQLESFSIKLAKVTDDMEKAYQSGDKEGFNKARDSLVDLAKKAGITDIQLSNLGLTFNDVKTASENAANATYNGADGADELTSYENALADATGNSASSFDQETLSMDANSASKQKQGNISEQLAGITEDQIAAIKENIAVYQTLSQVENLDEQQSSMLAQAKQYLANVYPYLAEGSKLNIQAMSKEAEHSDILLTATKMLTEGHLNAEQQMTLATILNAKTRMNVLLEQAQMYETFANKLAAEADAVAQSGLNDARADDLGIKASKFMGRAQSAYSNFSSELKKSMPDMDKWIKKLGTSINYYDNNTSSTKKNTSAKKDNNKATKDAAYVTDKYKQKIDEVNLAIEKQQSLQSKYPDYSKQNQNAIKEEIKQLKKKKELIDAEIKAVEKQIKTTEASSKQSKSVSAISGKSNQDKSWNFLKSKGFYDSAAAGIMGNLQLESGFNTKAVNPKSGATGLAQWYKGRLTELKKYAQSVGKAYTDINVQLAFFYKEMNSSDIKNRLKKYGGLSALKKMSVSEATKVFEAVFERSGGDAMSSRLSYANKNYSKYKGKSGTVYNNKTVDDLKAQLNDLRSQHIQVTEDISGKMEDLINSIVSGYERQKDAIDSSVSKSENKMETLVEYSASYRNEIDKQDKLLAKKQKINDEEIAFLQKQNKEQGLSAKAIDENKDKIKELQDLKLEDTLKRQELAFKKTQSAVDSFGRSLDSLNRIIDRSNKRLSLWEEGSKEYVKEIQIQYNALLDKQRVNDQEISYLTQERNKRKLTTAEIKKNTDEANKLTKANKQLKLSSAERAKNEKKIRALDADTAKKEARIERLSKQNDNKKTSAKQRAANNKEIAQLKKEINSNNDKIKKLEKENSQKKLTSAQIKANNDKIASLKKANEEYLYNPEQRTELLNQLVSQEDLKLDLQVDKKELEDKLKDVYNDVADQYIEAMKDAYEKERDIKQQQIDDILEAEEKAHDERMKQYDDEMDALDEIYNKKMREIDDTESANDYNKELANKQKELADIQAQINKLNLDDSQWAKKQRTDLEQQLADKQTEISEFVNDRNVELRKQSLEDERTAKEESIDQEREAEDKAWEERQDALNKQKEDIDRYYDNLINDERYWSKVRQDVLNGDIAQYKDKIGEITTSIAAGSKIIGESISNNIVDALNASLEALNSVSIGVDDFLSKIVDSNKSSVNKNPTLTGAAYLYKTPATSKTALASIKAGQKVEYISDEDGWAKVKYGGKTGYVKMGLLKFHEGGIVGKTSTPPNRLAELANKLFNTKPNEQVVKSLVGELQVPPKNIPNLFTNIGNMMDSILPKQQVTTAGETTVYMNFPNMRVEGGEQGAKSFFKAIDKGLKERGLK